MTTKNPDPGPVPGMTKRRPKPKTLLTPTEWAELHDALTLALDALGDGPADVDGPFLLNSIMHQRGALRLAHALRERMERVKP